MDYLLRCCIYCVYLLDFFYFVNFNLFKMETEENINNKADKQILI